MHSLSEFTLYRSWDAFSDRLPQSLRGAELAALRAQAEAALATPFETSGPATILAPLHVDRFGDSKRGSQYTFLPGYLLFRETRDANVGRPAYVFILHHALIDVCLEDAKLTPPRLEPWLTNGLALGLRYCTAPYDSSGRTQAYGWYLDKTDPQELRNFLTHNDWLKALSSLRQLSLSEYLALPQRTYGKGYKSVDHRFSEHLVGYLRRHPETRPQDLLQLSIAEILGWVTPDFHPAEGVVPLPDFQPHQIALQQWHDKPMPYWLYLYIHSGDTRNTFLQWLQDYLRVLLHPTSYYFALKYTPLEYPPKQFHEENVGFGDTLLAYSTDDLTRVTWRMLHHAVCRRPHSYRISKVKLEDMICLPSTEDKDLPQVWAYLESDEFWEACPLGALLTKAL